MSNNTVIAVIFFVLFIAFLIGTKFYLLFTIPIGIALVTVIAVAAFNTLMAIVNIAVTFFLWCYLPYRIIKWLYHKFYAKKIVILERDTV